MKKIMTIMIFMILIIPFTVKAIATNSSYTDIEVYFFYEDNCEECDKAKEWLETEFKEDYRVRIEYLKTEENKELNDKVHESLKIKKNKYPLMIVGSDTFIGFNEKTKNNLKEAIHSYEEVDDFCDVVSKIRNDEDIKECLNQNKDIYKEPFELPIYGIVLIVFIICVILGVFFMMKKKKRLK